MTEQLSIFSSRAGAASEPLGAEIDRMVGTLPAKYECWISYTDGHWEFLGDGLVKGLHEAVALVERHHGPELPITVTSWWDRNKVIRAKRAPLSGAQRS